MSLLIPVKRYSNPNSQLVYEVNILKIIAGSLGGPSNLRMIDMDYAKGDRMIFLILADAQYILCSCSEEKGTNRILVEGIQPLKCHWNYNSNEPIPTLSISNGGPIALICFPDQILITYFFNGNLYLKMRR
jgi:hypothetical protein